MANHIFQFKQFKIDQSLCAMKVGTDGVTLGAVADVEKARRVLDIGCGTGLLCLMTAQRNGTAEIVGIDIDEDAVRGATQNCESSKWAGRISIVGKSLQEFVEAAPSAFDKVITNPPYFEDSLKAPKASRTLARHTDSLPFSELASSASTLLSDDGSLSIILPTDAHEKFEKIAEEYGLYLRKKTLVYPKPGAEVKRVVGEFVKIKNDECKMQNVEIETLTVETEIRHQYTDDYIRLTKEFYLKM
ncbi:MAG: methyltransferase [Paludibacteraceae bacterium]|nr:methyltransferase [Paludibacteraceae bacterium]